MIQPNQVCFNSLNFIIIARNFYRTAVCKIIKTERSWKIQNEDVRVNGIVPPTASDWEQGSFAGDPESVPWNEYRGWYNGTEVEFPMPSLYGEHISMTKGMPTSCIRPTAQPPSRPHPGNRQAWWRMKSHIPWTTLSWWKARPVTIQSEDTGFPITLPERRPGRNTPMANNICTTWFSSTCSSD